MPPKRSTIRKNKKSTLKRKSRRQNKLTVSLVIPAYKAERTIEKTLTKTAKVMEAIRYNYEIICVVDGDIDRTYERAKKIASKNRKIKVYGYEENKGKGHAVRHGMAKAEGEIVGFMDVGLEIDPNGIGMLLEHFEWYKADIIVGSKRHAASKVTYPWYRKVFSLGYQTIVRLLFGLKVRDTQVGLKFFRKAVIKKTLPRLLVKKFAFDIEMLSVANHLGYKRIFEAPVELKMDFAFSSTIAKKGYFKTVFSMFVDTLAVFYRLYLIEYYEDKNRKNWIKHEYSLINRK